MKLSKRISMLICAAVITACQPSPDSPRGFSLPKGDVNNGKQVFLQYRCLACHTLEGIEAPTVDHELENPVILGGKVSRVKTYAELLTSIINPSHKLALGYSRDTITENGKSKMRVYNDVMTIAELVDIVAFLQIQYEVEPEQYTRYNVYRIP